jgi:ribosomal protein S18 acetylase RimI-like enzyme
VSAAIAIAATSTMRERASGIAVRALGPEDVDAYRALRLRGLAEHPEAFTSSSEEEAAKPPSALARRLARRDDAPYDVVLGAFEHGALVGLVGLDIDPRIKVRHRGHVFGMYVPAEHAGRGIGSELLAALIAHAERAGIAQLVLTVTAGNVAATTLYERSGFVAFGREPAAIVVHGTAYDKLHMIRILAGDPHR